MVISHSIHPSRVWILHLPNLVSTGEPSVMYLIRRLRLQFYRTCDNLLSLTYMPDFLFFVPLGNHKLMMIMVMVNLWCHMFAWIFLSEPFYYLKVENYVRDKDQHYWDKVYCVKILPPWLTLLFFILIFLLLYYHSCVHGFYCCLLLLLSCTAVFVCMCD